MNSQPEGFKNASMKNESAFTEHVNAVCIEKPDEICCKQVPYPSKKPHEVLIEMASAGICGSDVGAFRGTNPLVTYPRVIGHEVAGTIIAEGDTMPAGIKKGDRVIIDPYIYCNNCYPCSIGRTNCCEHLQVIGVHVDGAIQQVFSHPAALVHKLPDNLSFAHAPLAEPLTIALHALHRTRLRQDEHVVIIGAGAIGLLAALAAIYYQAIPILIDMVQPRLDYAQQLGVEHVINPMQQNSRQAVWHITGGQMAQVVVEASGANSAIRETLDLASFAGRIALTGWPKQETSLPTNLITFKELDICGSRTSAGEFAEALTLLSQRKIIPEQIITRIVAMEEIPDAVRELAQNPGGQLKINALF